VIKLGRIKFKVKDFRTDSIQANSDLSSPMKKKFNCEDDFNFGQDEFSEEAVEIECGVVDS